MAENVDTSHLRLDTEELEQPMQNDEHETNDMTIIANSFSLGHKKPNTARNGRNNHRGKN